MRTGPNILGSRTVSHTGDVALPTNTSVVTITGDDLSEGDTALSRRTQQIAVPLKRDDCSSYRTEWAGWASVSHPVAAGPLFLGIAQNGLACTGLRSRCSGKAVFGHRTEWGAGWAGLGWLTEVAARCKAVFPRSCGCGLRAASCGAAANQQIIRRSSFGQLEINGS